MGELKTTFQISSAPPVVDNICLRNVQLPLPSAPEAWHRLGQRQPCSMSLKLSCCSIVASAAEDDVSLSLDYGQLYRRIEEHVRHWPNVYDGAAKRLPAVGLHGEPISGSPIVDHGQDVTLLAGRIAGLALGYLSETALEINTKRAGTIQEDFGVCEIFLHLPKAILRAEQGLSYRCLSTLGHSSDGVAAAVVTEGEFRIQNIRCHCIIGINVHERLEKQTVIVSLAFKGPGHHQWMTGFMEMYQEMTRIVAEEVDKTTFQSVEALVTLIARIVTVDFGNELVTVRAEKPNALAFSEGTGVEVTRSRSFFV
ncbi:tetrahydrobiopterin biosynthesis enzymes-like protein [Aspergillus alliaceus]|uniref:dihydroneopterin aldolase n=1 Tax=Petromyces alliaceus TaxID=209559 RepID=A0A5N7C8M2_PETAA|nr:tetrahydrobiopterin biosynthesis enzymes-like protein [Aspergillus alliaceus]